jgi:hypothetical protein
MNSNTIFIAHPSNNEQLNSLKVILKAMKIKFEVTKSEKPYNPEFVNMVLDVEKEIKNSKGQKVSSDNFEDLWK